MSFFNLEWVKKNFDRNNLVFFEIGTAHIETSISVRKLFPNAEIYAFEAASHWHRENEEAALHHNIRYFKCAVCDEDGEVLFWPSTAQHGEPHPWSSSIFDLYRGPDSNTYGKEYGEPYLVECIRLDTFCNKHNICPDVIHIDAEGAEFKVFQAIGDYKPKCVWAEICAFGHYLTGVDYEQFNALMESIGYKIIFKTDNDALYCLNNIITTPYEPCANNEI
jgi:FkbM family methyltransferase